MGVAQQFSQVPNSYAPAGGAAVAGQQPASVYEPRLLPPTNGPLRPLNSAEQPARYGARGVPHRDPRTTREIAPVAAWNAPRNAAQPIGTVVDQPSRPVMPTQYQEPVAGAAPAAAAPQAVAAPQPVAQPAAAPAPQPVAQAPAVPAAVPGAIDLVQILSPQPNEHPLAAAVRWARVQAVEVGKIQDYTCTLVKRERIDGVLNDHEYMFVRVRHQPFSVYCYFLAPAKLKGQECMFVDGKNDGKMWAHPNGIKHKLVGTVSLLPTSSFAMAGNRYPVTELGVKRLTTRLIEVAESDMRFGESEVKVIPGAKINNRDCTCVQVLHPVPRKEFLYHIARVYVDNQMNLPVRFEAYEWPANPGEQPPLVEEYTYLNLKLNNGFTDADFDIANPNYQFK
jgi:hypothetical protein